MDQDGFLNILIAEDNDVSREMMAAVLRTQGYKVHGAIDGESAIKVVHDREIDLAIVDLSMAPTGGFEFVRYLIVKGKKIPVVIITANESSDVLTTASSLGVAKVIQKPVEPDRLLHTVQRILQRFGHAPATSQMVVKTHSKTHTPEQLMARAIELAEKNLKGKRGGPFGAVVADKEGRILGEGVSGKTGRVDPTAHAEVMAIRRAADKLGQSDLSECILYCSSEPTMMGHALILSVGIKKVYYGLSHDEVGQIKALVNPTPPAFTQLGHDEALAMFKAWQAQK
jgi:guanine deaminase